MQCTCKRVNVSEDARAMRRTKGQHTVSPSEHAALVGHGTASLRAANEPPDGYQIAFDKQRRPAAATPTTLTGTPPDGYAIALDKQRLLRPRVFLDT